MADLALRIARIKRGQRIIAVLGSKAEAAGGLHQRWQKVEQSKALTARICDSTLGDRPRRICGAERRELRRTQRVKKVCVEREGK